MTRKEEIIQAAIKESPRLAERRVGFIAGAMWSDTHPHWVSVKDERPPIKKRIIIALWKYQDETDKVREVLFVSKGHMEDWLPRVSHWMPMPTPPEHIADASKMMPKGGEQ